MTEKIFKYKAEGRDYDIPESRVNDFLDMYPNATVRANVDGRDYDIPHAKMPDFLKAYPNASYTLDSPLSTVVDTNYEPTLPESEEDAPEMSRRERRQARREARRNDDRPSWGESAAKGVGAGFTRTGKGLLDALHQLSAGMLYNDPETGEAKRLESYDTQMQDDTNTFRNASVLASETAEELSREADPTGGEKGFVDLIAEGKIGMALQKGLSTGAESLPMTLSAYNPWTMALNAISMAGANYAEETLDNPEIDPWKRAVKAIGSAAIEQAVEKFADPVFKYIGGGKGAGELTEELAKELVERGTKEATENIAKRIFRVLKNTAKDAAGEGVEEVVTSFGNDALGQALDWIDGDKDYGISAQWEQMKSENPDADAWDFALAKGKEYMDSFIGGALSGGYMSGTANVFSEGAKFKYDRDARKILDESHAIGSSLDYGDMYDSDDTVREQIDAVAATFTNENGEASISGEFIGTLSSEDAFALSRRNDFTPEQRNALFGLARAKAIQEGLTTKLDERLESQINDNKVLIEDATENGSIITAMYGGKPVYVMGAWNKGDGTVTAPSGQNGPVMVVDALTGEKSYARSEDIQFAESRNPTDYAAEVETMLRENDARNRQVAQSTMSVRAKAKAVKPFAGKKILVDVGNGLAEVLVQQISPNGDVIIKGKKGDLGGQSIMTLSADVFYDSIYRDEDGNPVITEAPQEAEAETPQEEAPVAETTGNEDYRGQTISILLNGVPTEVEVMSQDNPSDSIVYEYTDASGNRRTASSTIGAFNAAIQQAAEYVAPTPTAEETPSVETAPADSETQAPQEVPVTPENIDWDALFEQDPEAYFVELQNQFGEEALDILNEEVVAAQEELDSLSKKRGKTQNERLENRQKKVALQGRIDTLNGMIARLAPAAAPVVETPATETPAEVAPTEQPTAPPETAPAVTETTPVTETPTVPESTEPAPVEQTPVAETPAETVAEPEPAPVTTESTPVAPNPVDNPAREAQKREKALAQQLQRYGISPEQKSDMAFNAGKAVGDFFATREEYDAYAENATDLGDYNEDFERGVEASFANRQQNIGNSPVNSVPLETEPNGENNGEEGTSQGTIREGQTGVPGSEQTYDEGAEEGASSPQAVRGSGADNSGLIEDRYPARKGDITRQELTEAFGLNSVSPAINQEVLNSVYDFMMEMSKMLGISPKSIGHGATLGVKTLKDNSRARAQYSYKERIDGTITDAYLNFKNSKLSSIAHEWFHSLDQALSYYETGKGKRSATNATAGEFAGRKETLDAIKGILKAINKSGHKERLKKELWFDKAFLRYSLRKDEMTARAFEEYIRMKFAEAGIEVEGLSENATNHPTSDEMAVIAPAFDNLFKVLQEKEGKTPGTSVLYHIGEIMEEESDARQLATEAVLTALDDNGIDVVRATDEQTQQMMDASGANAEFMVSPDNPTFVSNAARAVEAIKMEKATPAQWLAMIEKNGGLKAGEDKWMGLSDWLKASKAKTLTKTEVLDFINENMIIIEEQHYASLGEFAGSKKLEERYPGWDNGFSVEWEGYMEEPHGEVRDEEAAVALYNQYHEEKIELDEEGSIKDTGDYLTLEAFAQELAEIYYGEESDIREINGVREDYTTGGLVNLHEIALTVPTIEPWNETDDTHFGDAGDGRAVAWVRFGETEVTVQDATQQRLNEIYDRLAELEMKVSSTGITEDEYNERARLRIERDELQEIEPKTQRVLVIDEIQSKRHQEGRERGYKVSREKADAEMDKFMKRMHDKYNFSSSTPFAEVFNEEEMRELARLNMQQHRATFGTTSVPDAPFDKNWHELAMKRMLRYAAEEGYDVIAWTKGEQQAERYDIGGVVSEISVKHAGPSGYEVESINGSGYSVLYGVYPDVSAIAEVYGNELAERITDSVSSYGDKATINGNNLKVGGEGMKGFYDRMLPAFMNKYGKKWGIKVADITLPYVEEAGRVMHSVPVTEAMKESVKEGQPMFMKRPNGTVYGWTDGKKIYLTEAGINPNTPIHEYTHLWAKAMMQKNPKGWNSIKKLLKGTPVWNEVMSDPNYSSIHNDEDAVASEALSRISGTENAAKMEQMAQQMIDEAKGTARKLEARGLIQNMRDALNKFWKWVGTNLFGIEKFESVEQVTDRVLWDLLNNTDLGTLSEGQVETQIVTDPKVIAELEASPKRTGYRNVVQNEDGTFSSPMAYWLQSTKEGAKSRVETAKFELGKWEEAEEHPELVDEKGHVALVKPNKSTVEVAYDPYIHNRLDPVNLQFKDAWKRDELVYVETVVPETDLESGYHADQALLPVGVHSWSNGDVMLSKYDKPVRIMPWEAVADAWVERLNGNGVHFDVVPPALRSLLVERGVEILPPHKGMGKDCNDAYKAWKKDQGDEGLLFRSSAITPQMDADYLAAVERGDMETAQRMVLEAAKLAMPNTKVVDEDGNPKMVWRASRYGKRTDYTVFDTEKTGGRGFYFANKEAAEKWYGGENLRAFFLDITNPDTSNDFNVLQAETKYSPDNDGVIFAPKGMDDISFEAKAFYSSQIKSAEPVTYDDNGNVIPLSERFNPENEDIRYRRGEINANFVEQFEFKQNNERQELEYSDEFRRLQEESSRMSGQLVSEKDGVQQAAIRGLVGRIGGTLQRELDRATSGRGNKLRTVVNESKGTSFDIIENVDGRLFHDIFEIVRAYLPNGELVDLHDNYDDAICYITSDGLAGFAVSSDGNLISVYSLYGKSKKGFLGAIKDLITEAGATHLDGYNSRLQPLAEIYSKVFGWKVASMMDYNMEYDHDNIAENHGMPQVAFMVNSEAEIPTRHFNEDQYDEAVEYQLEQVEISQRVDSQNAAIDNLAGEPRLRAIEHAVSKEAAKLGVNVTYASREDMPRGHKNDKGYYNTKTGEIVICTENASSIADAIQTILHEAVAHKGLRQLMGDRFNEFISRVYESLDAETKAKVDALAAASDSGNTTVAMEEYIASLAETTDFDNNSVWSKIKSIFEDIINAILGRNDIKIGDNELRYILRASYNNMVNPRFMESTRGWAQDQMMREEYAINEATPEILSRTGIDPSEVATETARQVYSRTVQTRWQEAQRQFQDAMQPVRIAIDAIQQETGNIPIEDYENYLLIKNQASSRSRVEIDNFQRRYFSPVVEQVNKIIDQIMESRGWNVKDKSKRAEVYSEVKQYLIAKHGLERNELFRSTKGEDRDYSGLTALFGLEAEEYVDAERMAQELVDNFESEVSTDELWAKINAATNKTLRHSYECGLLSRSQYEQIRDMFEFYIPLRGFDETTAEDVYSYLRFESNSFSPAVKEAKGRTSIADDPLAYIMTMAESEITQGNNNRAKQALFNFLLNRASATGKQNTLMQVEDVWYVKSVDGSGVVTQQIAAPNHAAGETYEEFEARMQALEATGDAFKSKKGQVDVGMRFQVKRNQNAHYIYLKVNGVEKAIYINGDPKAADAVNGRYAEKPGALEGKMREINRLISSTFTNYSLEFTFRNYFRDMVYANINIGVKESNPAYRRRFRRNWAHNNMRSMIKMLKAYRAGEYEGRTDLNEDEAAFVEFMENGGQTGYTLINSVESRKKDLERAIERMQNGIDKGGVRDSTVFRYTLGGIELLNEASELVTRFAAFKTSRDMGRSVLESVNDAKEITVNFNTKGAQDGKGWMGAAARWFGATKFFFNATVQGVQNVKAMADANKLKFGTVVGSLVATGFLMPVLQGMLTGLLGGDDDENWYWDIPQYDRQSAFCVVTGKGKYVKVPLPVGLNKMYALGDVFASWLFDKKHTHNVMDVGKEMANLVAGTILPVNPLEGTVNELSLMRSTINAVAPSSTQAVIQYLSNTDWKGAPIQKEYTYNRNDPQWMKAYNSNPAVLKALSKWCYENVKWDGWFRGWDWSPEHLDNTLSNFGGGIYSLIKKTGQAMSMIWNEEDRDISKIPVVGVLFGTVDDRFGYVNEAYYDLKEEFDSEVDPIKKTAKAFGYSLDEVFKPVAEGGKRAGDNHPKMQKDVYGNRHFEHMQAWYLGQKKLESINDKIEKQEKKMAKIANPPQGEIDKMTKLQAEYETTRTELVNGMLESKYEQIIDKFRK